MDEAQLNHPGDKALLALSMGNLVETELGRISTHLDDCPACCLRIDQLASDDRLLARLQHVAASRTDVLVNPAQRRLAVRALRRSAETRSTAQEPVPSVLPVPRQIGDYDVEGEVGRGGMGVVYKAWHRKLQRHAALKVVLAGEFASHTQELRSRLEAELAARVRHPNIVQVFEIGDFDGRPFMALEWVEGGSLAEGLVGKHWTPGEAAALVETIARAIHVAHGEGIVHRDLKPANIMMTADCVPRVTDFGLAQPTSGGATLTQTGLLIGTPGYMSPEQVSGKRALIGPATDIYALGVILYELLTGQLPFQGESTLEVLRAVTSEEPVRPRRVRPGLPRDLQAVTLHCLEKEPAHRYPSALALAEDLQRFREGQHVIARPVGAVVRIARAGRRRPLVASLLALLAISLLAGLGGVTWKWLEANDQRDLANVSARQAEAEKQAALYQAYRASIAAAGAALQNHEVADAARHLEAGPTALRGWEWRHLHSRLDDSSSVVRLPEGEGFLIAGPDQLRVGVLTSAGLRLTDLKGGGNTTLALSPERRRPVSVTSTSRGLRIAAWVGNTAFDLLDDAGQVLCRVATPENDQPITVVVSPDGTRLCVQTDANSKRIAVFDTTSGKETAGARATMMPSGLSPSALMARGSPRAARIERRACGTRRPANSWPPAGGTRARWLASPLARTARAS